MATTVIQKSTVGDLTYIKDSDADATATLDVMNGSCRLLSIYINNAVGTPVRGYLKLYDSLEPTIGTSHPDYVLDIASSGKIPILCNGSKGFPFKIGMSYAFVKHVSYTDGPGSSGSDGPGAGNEPVVGFILLEGLS